MKTLQASSAAAVLTGAIGLYLTCGQRLTSASRVGSLAIGILGAVGLASLRRSLRSHPSLGEKPSDYVRQLARRHYPDLLSPTWEIRSLYRTFLLLPLYSPCDQMPFELEVVRHNMREEVWSVAVTPLSERRLTQLGYDQARRETILKEADARANDLTTRLLGSKRNEQVGVPIWEYSPDCPEGRPGPAYDSFLKLFEPEGLNELRFGYPSA